MGVLRLSLDQERILRGSYTERGEVVALLQDLRQRTELEQADILTLSDLIDDLFDRLWELEEEVKGLKADPFERLKELFENQVAQLQAGIDKIEQGEHNDG